MSTADAQADIAAMTRILRVMSAVLIAFLLGFLGLVAFVRFQQRAMPLVAVRESSTAALALAAIVGAAAGVALGFVPSWIVSIARRRIVRGTWRPPRPAGRSDVAPSEPEPIGDAAKLAHVYQAQWIAAAALNEGFAFLAMILYMLDGRPIELGLALVLVLVMALRIPTRARVESWIDQQLQLVAQERQLGGCPGP